MIRREATISKFEFVRQQDAQIPGRTSHGLSSTNKSTNHIELGGIYKYSRGVIPVKVTMRCGCSRYTGDVPAIVTEQLIVSTRPSTLHSVHKSSQAQHVPVLGDKLEEYNLAGKWG